MTFNVLKSLEERPLSWSAINSFEYDPEQWFNNYVRGIKASSKEMTFGSMIDKKLQEDPTFLPHVPRYPILQHDMSARLGKIPLRGVADAYDPTIPALRDYKTGKKLWDQKRANDTGQLTMYCLLLHLTDKVKPEHVKLFIDWLPTQDSEDLKTISLIDEKDIKTFETRRSMRDVLEFGVRINAVLKSMQMYVNSRA
jgi:hypothetical protein